jgi:hypothetical protein
MSDETGEVDTPSNSVSAHREPPPSLGMVAHIWAGHLEPLETAESDEESAEVALEPVASELPSHGAARVDAR